MILNKNKYLWSFSVATAAVFGAFIGYSILAPTVNTSAIEDTASSNVRVGITPTIALSAEGADASGDLIIDTNYAAGNIMGTGQIVIKVSTNDPEGYSLFINTDKADTTLSQDGVTARVRALDGETAVEDFPENYWGYSIDGGLTYYPVQPDTNNPALYPEATETAPRAKVHNSTADEDETEFTIGAKIGATLPSGTYNNTVVFTAVPNMDIGRALAEQANP